MTGCVNRPSVSERCNAHCNLQLGEALRSTQDAPSRMHKWHLASLHRRWASNEPAVQPDIDNVCSASIHHQASKALTLLQASRFLSLPSEQISSDSTGPAECSTAGTFASLRSPHMNLIQARQGSRYEWTPTDSNPPGLDRSTVGDSRSTSFTFHLQRPSVTNSAS